MWLMVETYVKWSTGQTHEQWRTWPRYGEQYVTADLNMGHELQHIHGGTTQARTGDPLRVRQTSHMQSIASVDLTSRWQPMATRMAPHMLDRASDHDGTIR